MAVGSRAWRALMRRNLVYRRRNWIGTILEVLLPVGFVGVLLGIKIASQDSSSFAATTVPPLLPPNSMAYSPLSFRDYVTALQAQRQCILVSEPSSSSSSPSWQVTGMASDSYNWQVPFVKCDSRRCMNESSQVCEYTRLGVSGTDAANGSSRARAFRNWLYNEYPALTDPNQMHFQSSTEFVMLFDTETDMDNYITSPSYGTNTIDSPKLSFGIVFDGDSDTSFTYKLRQNSTNYNAPEEQARPAQFTTPPTNILLDSFAKNDFTTCVPAGGTPAQGPLENSCTGQYVYNGVLTMQRLVNDFILDISGAKEQGYFVSQSGVSFVQFPTPEYVKNGFYAALSLYGPLLVTLGLLYPVAAMITYIVREKELKQKELMKMMSVSESDIGWAWFVTFYLLAFATASACAGVSMALYESSKFLYLWIFWVLVFLAVTVFCMAISALTAKTVRAVLIGLLVFFIGVFLTLAVSYETGNPATIAFISLHPVAAFSYGLQEIGNLEDQGVGLTANSISQTDSPSGYTFITALSYLALDSVVWGFLTFYLNRVIRPDYGQALPLWFPFTVNYWCPGRSRTPKEDESDENKEEVADIPNEPVGSALTRQTEENKTIEIHHLHKVFGEKIAVDGLTLSMYSNQITALLGHNGAGKTTTINCLTGAMDATSGYATVMGMDTRTQMGQIRQDIGICLQHDCLFPMLTVREHVQFFSRIKGLYKELPYKEAEEHVDQAIQDVALAEKRNTLSKNLSGGMKRKLSVAIAFCGGSKVVLLDEPTSGMDPFSRRFTWNVIRQYRQDRCIILTTHFMDEADILGDRIAIMAEGQLRCCGSSLFLKKTYGVGYCLTIERLHSHSKSIKAGEETATKSKSDSKKKKKKKKTSITNGTDQNGDAPPEKEEEITVEQLVEHSVKEASLLSDVGSEISYQLPLGAASKFPPMFEALDELIEKKTISSYGVSLTTLEEVFLLVARGETGEKQELSSSHRVGSQPSTADLDKSARSRMDLENEGLFLIHLAALFKKRAASFRRDKKAWCCTTVVPSLFVLVGLIVFTFASPARELEPLFLSLQDYNSDITAPPRNPIVYNSPDGPYDCQPGGCAYQSPSVTVNATNEQYYFCGYQARFVNQSFCSITDSVSVMGNLDSDGAVTGAVLVETIEESSTSLYATVDQFAASKYGAIFFSHGQSSTVNGREMYNMSVLAQCAVVPSNYSSSIDCVNFGGYGYVVQYNFTALHSSPLFQSLADEALLQEALDSSDVNIGCTIDPLPITNAENNLRDADDAFSAWFLVILSFPFIAGAFATFIVNERQSKAKHLQTVAGVEPTSYWLSSYVWDILNYQIPLWITIALIFAFDVEVLTKREYDVLGGTISLLVFFGPAAAGYTYCVSFAFSSPSLCNVFIIISGFLIGMGGPLAVFILSLIGFDPASPKPNLIDAANIVKWLLRFFPTFNLGQGLFAILNLETIAFLEGGGVETVFSEPVMLYELIFLGWQSVVYVALAIQLDKWSSNPRILSYWRCIFEWLTCQCIFGRKKSGDDLTLALPEDDDVMAEQNRVLSGQANDDLIVLSQLTKQYDNGKLAVNNLSFGIPPGECFGLLGINGAGKTSTMAMLTAEFPPSSGDATLSGHSISKEPEKIRRRIGYCPQFDAHFDNLTGREHVELYASIKGIPAKYVKEAAAEKLKEVGLGDKDADRLSAGYSGGMKRRLSLACATIGQPRIVFLDECSTGVDPVARREIWQLVSDMVSGDNCPEDERTSVILTTHSMEECEALCPRIAIMANGRLRCLGSAQRLKSKFGQGFQVELKVKLTEREDTDFLVNAATLLQSKNVAESIDAEIAPDVFLSLDETVKGLQALSGDDFLSAMISAENPIGYNVWKDASSPIGASIEDVAAFATTELRMRALASFIDDKYPNSVQRERQDTKVRYEIDSKNVRLANIFATIEANKEKLLLAEYGVSQTSLEQVFNMHAAEAEKLKHGRNDG